MFRLIFSSRVFFPNDRGLFLSKKEKIFRYDLIFFKVENMGKPYLKQVVKWRQNEAPEGLMQICVGT